MCGCDGYFDYYLIVVFVESDGEFQWGGYGSEFLVISKWDGLVNIKVFVEEGGYFVVEFVVSVIISGYNDFYFLVQVELMFVWVNVLEVFVEGWYWSSMQYFVSSVFSMGFSGGSMDGDDKDYDFCVCFVCRLFC